MDIVKLTISTLDGGNAEQEINQHIQKIVQDVIDREDIGAARKVKIEVSIKPGENPMDGSLMPYIDWSVSSSVPGIKGSQSRGYVKDGTLKVRQSGDDPIQGRFEDEGNVAVIGQ